MTDVTFETAASANAAAAPVHAKRGFWRRLFESMVEARLGQARAMIERHRLSDQTF